MTLLAPSSQPTPPVRILIVEDDVAMRLYCAKILQEEGFVALPAPDVDHAIALINAGEQIDAAIVNAVFRPGPAHTTAARNGWALTERLWNLRPRVPVLMMSGFRQDRLRQKKPNGIGFLQKPFSPCALARSIRALLQARD